MKLSTKIKIATAIIALLPFVTFALAIRFAAPTELRDVIQNVIIIIISVDSLLMVWIYYSVIAPLNKLKKAAKMIEKGNLDFELKPDADDELGQLCKDLEEMRIRLKDTAEKKIRYDKQNKELIRIFPMT